MVSIGGKFTVVVAGVLAIAGSCTSGAPDQRPLAQDGSPQSAKPCWSATDDLPILERTLLQPRAGGPQFENRFEEFTFRAAGDQQAAKEAPFADDADAVRAATVWIRAHFDVGELEFEATSIQHSASGNDAPRDDSDRGHTIVLRELYNGMRTDGGAVVYLAGRSVSTASIKAYAYTPVPGTAHKCVDQAAIAAQWRSWLEQQGTSPEELAIADGAQVPRLVFCWSPLAKRDSLDQEFELPTWVPHDHVPFRIDGHSGKAWWDD